MPGDTVDNLSDAGILHPECANIFRAGKTEGYSGTSLLLHKHQEEAIAIAKRKESYVLTTGTGSGKSLSYFIPIVDSILRTKEQDSTSKTRAIIIYPMNALANSQIEELEQQNQELMEKLMSKTIDTIAENPSKVLDKKHGDSHPIVDMVDNTVAKITQKNGK